jgi:hypothetical protein
MKVKFMPATTDPCDGLNKKLDSFSIQYYERLFNRIAYKAYLLNAGCFFVVRTLRYPARVFLE